jgi:general secretion pathway protein D
MNKDDDITGFRAVRWVNLVLLWTAVCLFPVACPAQSQTKTAAAPAARFVTIDFNDVDIGVFIKFISELTGKNFIIDRRVRGKVTVISPSRISVEEAYRVFESVLEVHGYTTVKAGKVIKIVPAPDARTKNIETKLREENGRAEDKVVTQLIQLKYADATEIRRLFTPLISKSSVMLAYPPTNTVIVTDVYSNIKRLLKILKAVDVPGMGQELTVMPLKYADAADLVKILQSVFRTKTKPKKGELAAPARFVADERTGSIIVLASEIQTTKIKSLIDMLDKEAPQGSERVRVYYLENASAEELVKVLQEMPKKKTTVKKGKQQASAISENVKITADKATNSLIITAKKEDYAVLEDIIRKLDIPRAMVYIEALIMEVNVTKDFRLGTEWVLGDQVNVRGRKAIAGAGFSGGSLGALPGDDGYQGLAPGDGAKIPLPPGFSMGIFGPALKIGNLVFPNISAIVQAYQKDRDVNILSTPQILTTDNQEASIMVGKNIPFQTKATTTNNETFSSFEYRDVGKMLKVTPIISKDNMVRLNIALEVTALESTTDFRPTTLKRNINTTVIVRDGGTVVLGGLIEDLGVTADYKLPCLGRVPLIGWLLRSRAKAGEKSNLYIFLTPHVINNPKDALNVYQMKREHIDRIKSGHIKMYEKGLKNAPSGGTLQPQQISPGEAVKKPLPPAPGSGAVDKPTQSGSSATEPKSP